MLIKLDSSTISQDGEDFEIAMNNFTLDSNKEYACALLKASVWYSWHNISTIYQNNTLRYSPDGGTTFKSFTFPNGIYSIQAINSALESFMLAENDYTVVSGVNTFHIKIQGNMTTLKSEVILSNNYQLDLSQSTSIRKLLGFDAVTITAAGTTSSSNPANITRDVNSILISSNIISGSWDNGSRGQILYAFQPDVGPGNLINIEPTNLTYLPLSSNQINHIRIKITDQLSRPVYLNGEHVTIFLVIKEKNISY